MRPTEEEKAELATLMEKRRLEEWSEAFNGSPQRIEIRRVMAQLKVLVIESALNTDLEAAMTLRDDLTKAVLACKEAGATVNEVQSAQNYWHKLLEAGHFRREPGK